MASVEKRRSDVGLLEYKAVLHHRDIVEEIATQRHGEIDAIDQYISDGKKQPPHRWRVRFLDGGEPAFQYFLNEEHLRLIRCPHEGQCIMKERPGFRRSKPDEAPPPLRCAVQSFAPLRRR